MKIKIKIKIKIKWNNNEIKQNKIQEITYNKSKIQIKIKRIVNIQIKME